MRTLQRVKLQLGIAVLVCSAICCKAQVVDPMTAAQAPVPGVGHHYIGMATETVNPADGSVSFHLPIMTPAGRGLSFPFGITYSGSAPFSLDNSNSPWFGWDVASGFAKPPLSINGWSYDLPSYVAQAFVGYSQISPATTSPNNFVYDYCWQTDNYQFTGFDGQRSLNQVYSFPDNGNPDLPTYAYICDQNGGGGYGGGNFGWGDNGVTSVLGPAPYGSGPSYNTQPSLTVNDRHGNVYQFPQGAVIGVSPTLVGVQTFGALAQTITDRNGNQIVLNGTSLLLGGSTLLPPGSYTDTAGRPIVSWTGIGSSTGDQLTVSGLGAITVKWTTTAMTFPTGSTNLYSLSTPCSNAGATGSITVSVVSEIDLPNGQTYAFTYGGAWGRLIKITFPDGGYVRYLWGTNSRSMGTYQTWVPYGMTQGHAYCLATLDTPAITDRYVSFDGTTEVLHQNFSKYTTNWVLTNVPSLSWTGKSTEVTTTDMRTNQTTIADYSYTWVLTSLGPNDRSWQVSNQVPVERTITYMDGTKKVLKTINKTWTDRYAMVGDQTMLDNGQGITQLRCFDQVDRVLASYEYNFQSAGAKPADPACPSGQPVGGTTLSAGLTTTAIGPLMRQSATVYHTFTGTNILDEPDTVTTSDGSGNMLSQAAFLYDNGTVASSGAATGLVSPPGPRGNATSVSRWLNATNSYLATTYAYFDTGQIHTMTDPCGQPSASCPDISGSNHTTTYAYTDAYASGTGTPPGQTNAYLTQVTFPNTGIAHQESFTWGYNDGLLRSHVDDQNNQTTNYCYLVGGCSGTVLDKLLRLTQVQGPPDPNNGNQNPATTYTYGDWTTTNKTASSITKAVLQNTGGTTITTKQIFDGMGHVTDSETTDASGMDNVHTVFDGFGRVYTVSTPYRSTSDPTYSVATTLYDAIGRTSSHTDSDQVSTQKWSYSGATTTYTDENNNQWTRSNDALGRLIQVLEPNGYAQTPTMETDYTYDLLDNLQSVKQWGGPVNSAGMHSRSFSYDSLSRLIQSFNPESGWVCYGTTAGAAANGSNCFSGYDANGNLQAKTDARGVTTQYTYDYLNRVLSKRYVNDVSATPSSCYQYDSSSLAGTNANLVGRLTNQWTQRAVTGTCASALPASGVLTRRSILAYDPLGHATSEQQCTPVTCAGTPYKPTYSYDLAGEMTTMSNGITGTPTVGTLGLTYAYDSTGRLQTVKSNWSDSSHPGTLFSAQAPASSPCANASTAAAYLAPYTPFGSLQNAALGASLTLNRNYDNRLRPTCEIDKSGVVPAATPGSATILITGAEQSK